MVGLWPILLFFMISEIVKRQVKNTCDHFDVKTILQYLFVKTKNTKSHLAHNLYTFSSLKLHLCGNYVK